MKRTAEQMLGEALAAWDWNGQVAGALRYGAGHINDTFCVYVQDEAGDCVRYILQRINTNTFKDPKGLMENICGVTGYLRRMIEEQGGDAMRETMNVVPTRDGQPYYADTDGGAWRVYTFVEGTVCLQKAETPEDFYESAVAFGNFQRQLAGYDEDAVGILALGEDLVCERGDLLLVQLLDLLLERYVAFEEFLDRLLNLGIVQQVDHVVYLILHGFEHRLGLLGRDGLDTSYAGRDGALADDLEQTDRARSRGMRTAAQLNRVAEADHAHAVTVLLAEEHDGPCGACLLDGGVTTFLKRIVGTDGLVDKTFHLAQLLGRNLLEV